MVGNFKWGVQFYYSFNIFCGASENILDSYATKFVLLCTDSDELPIATSNYWPFWLLKNLIFIHSYFRVSKPQVMKTQLRSRSWSFPRYWQTEILLPPRKPVQARQQPSCSPLSIATLTISMNTRWVRWSLYPRENWPSKFRSTLRASPILQSWASLPFMEATMAKILLLKRKHSRWGLTL